MATPEQVAELENEWRRQGVPDEEIGQRIARLVAEEAARAESETPDAADGEAVESGEAPGNGDEPPPTDDPEGAATLEQIAHSEGWPDCPVCRGIGKILPQLQHSSEYETCPECAGLGETLTGSLKEGQVTKQCGRCMGDGYTARTMQPATPPPPEHVPQRSW